jgi:hypothetical protein
MQTDNWNQSTNYNDSCLTGRSLINRKNYMPLEEMHYIAVKHYKYIKNIEKS